MANHRLLFFRANRLERWEELDAASYEEAIQSAAERAKVSDADCIELWYAGKRIATFKARLGRHGR